MAKKFSLLLAAIAVVAFAVPAFASAAPELTIGGVKAGEGAAVTGTSNNTVTKTSIGNLTCATVTVNGKVTVNNGTTIEAEGAGAAVTTECFFKGTTPIVIDDPTLTRLHTATAPHFTENEKGELIETPGKGTANLTFVATLPKNLTCHYLGTNVPATYKATSNVVSISGPLTATPEACGTASIAGDFTLTSGENAVVIH